MLQASTTRDPVIFVVADGVRWQEVFRGTDPALAADTTAPRLDAAALTPNLHGVIAERGAAMGAPGRGSISASGPRFVSLPSYREIFSGQASLDCLDNQCTAIERTTLVDELRDRGGKAAVFSSWPTIARAVAKHNEGVTVSTGLSPSDGDVEPYPGDQGFRPDRLTARAALEHLEQARPDFLFLGLGEPDEYAHRGDYAGYVGSIQAVDRTIGDLQATLARHGGAWRAHPRLRHDRSRPGEVVPRPWRRLPGVCGGLAGGVGPVLPRSRRARHRAAAPPRGPRADGARDPRIALEFSSPRCRLALGELFDDEGVTLR